MKPFNKVHSKNRRTQRERGEYAVMKKNQRKARRRQEHVEDDFYTGAVIDGDGFELPAELDKHLKKI